MRPTESSALDLPLPSRNFAATRRILQVVLAAAVLIPLVCLIGYGYYDYQRRTIDANDVTDRLVRVAQEHALKVLDLNNEMATRIIDLLDDSDDAEIRAHEALIHRRLSAIGGDFPQIAAISVFGETGDVLASSRYYPVPKASVANREDFLSARAIRPEPYFSLPLRGVIGQADVFVTNTGRTAINDGQFLGVVSIALQRKYFADFYRELVSDNPAVTIGLYRRDGGILLRYPEARPGVMPAANTPFTRALHDGLLFGRLRMTSTVDDVDRLLSFRRVGSYPLYVVTGYATDAIFDEWWHHYLLIAAITAVPCFAVCVLVLFSLRQLRAEQIAWERWQAEVAMRLSAEASSRQMRRMGALGNLVANVAHDFNNLLMVVSTNMGLARRKGFNNLEREVVAVERATVGAQSLARRLLSVARKQPLKQDAIDFASWLPAATHLIQTAVGDKVQVSMQVVSDLWPVFADATELEFAIINIAVNARDAMPLGGRFAIRGQNVRLTASDTQLPDGEYVLVSLTDDGEGMTESVLKRAFEPLFTTKFSGAGTGLGLAQVLAVCEQAGGTARIDSVPERGTTVRLYLPRYQGEQVPLQPVAPPAPSSADATQGTVLLVEDNDDVAAGVAAVLEVFGCKVRHEPTADAALDTLNAGDTFDLVLSDIQMPGRLSGIDLAERVKRTWPDQRIALMTGYADELERARHLGVPILAKPFDIDELRGLVACTP
ncbi:ATP-binding protein [Paraburkholderia sp. GAS42]|uniref:hybrid sensor histidine kinase/response regulator n=1 Tax=Paraburkholderia sp. GAS42 TaxID=3035135 RepID=UPI003D223C0B